MNFGEMIDFVKYDKSVKISEKVDKPNTDNGFNILFFIGNRTSQSAKVSPGSVSQNSIQSLCFY